MLVQHFLPASSATTVTNSTFSPSSPSSSSLSSSIMKNKKTSILSPFFNSESTGFQPTIDEGIRLGYTEKIKTHLSAWPKKLTSVMEIQRQRFSQLNPRFKQQQQQQPRTATTVLQPVQQSVLCPVILPSASRPQPRQQARSKHQQQTHLPPARSTRRSNTAHVKQKQQQPRQGQQQQQPSMEPNNEYITLANLTKILHVLQTKDKINDNETSTDTSTSTTNSAKQRVQQHLQETAVRWWKPIRSSDCQSSIPPSSSILTHSRSVTPAHLLSPKAQQQRQRGESDNLPLLTIVSNSTRQLAVPSSSGNAASKYDESESSTEIQTTIISSYAPVPQSVNSKRARQEPLIMQARGMRLRSYDHHYYNNQNNMNFFQQQRLIRQT